MEPGLVWRCVDFELCAPTESEGACGLLQEYYICISRRRAGPELVRGVGQYTIIFDSIVVRWIECFVVVSCGI